MRWLERKLKIIQKSIQCKTHLAHDRGGEVRDDEVNDNIHSVWTQMIPLELNRVLMKVKSSDFQNNEDKDLLLALLRDYPNALGMGLSCGARFACDTNKFILSHCISEQKIEVIPHIVRLAIDVRERFAQEDGGLNYYSFRRDEMKVYIPEFIVRSNAEEQEVLSCMKNLNDLIHAEKIVECSLLSASCSVGYRNVFSYFLSIVGEDSLLRNITEKDRFHMEEEEEDGLVDTDEEDNSNQETEYKLPLIVYLCTKDLKSLELVLSSTSELFPARLGWMYNIGTKSFLSHICSRYGDKRRKVLAIMSSCLRQSILKAENSIDLEHLVLILSEIYKSESGWMELSMSYELIRERPSLICILVKGEALHH